MESLSRPTVVVSTPLGSTENVYFPPAHDQVGSVGGRKVSSQDQLEYFERSGLAAMRDHELASRGKLSLAGSAVKGGVKLLLSFKIAQTAADGAMFLYGRLTKAPFHAKMDENLEQVMHDISKGNISEAVKFDPKSYMECMDQFVLGDSIKLPDNLLQELNTVLVKMLTTRDNQEAVKHDVAHFLEHHQGALQTISLSPEIIKAIDQGNGILTPRILLAKLARDIKASGGMIDENTTQSFANDCKKVADYYDQRTAMSLYAKSLSNMKLMEVATKPEFSRLNALRGVLNKSTDFLMGTVPYIYMFVVANLIIDRNGSGATKIENFNAFMDENYSNVTGLQEIKDFANNYFTTDTVDQFALKWGNLLPTTMAISLYFLSTLRLGVNFSSPEKHETFVNQGMARLLDTYKLILTEPGQAVESTALVAIQPNAGDAGAMERYQSLPEKPETSDEKPAGVDETDKSELLAETHTHEVDKSSQPTGVAEVDATDDATDKDATDKDATDKSVPLAEAHTHGVDKPSQPTGIEEVETTEKSSLLAEAPAHDMDKPSQPAVDGNFVTINLEDIDSQPDHLKSAAIARAYFNYLSGSRESKLEKIYVMFSGGLIGVRALNNVAFEGKDATPDVPVRDWIYDNVCSKIIIPLSAIENRGVIDKMMSEQEKSRIIGCLGKIMDGQNLTIQEEDFMRGVMGSKSESSYGFAKVTNSVLTAAFMAFHLGVLFTDFITSVRDPKGKSALDPLFNTSMGLMNAGLVYKLFYRPALEVLNVATFAMQHGRKNISNYFYLAAWNVIGRSITSAPALPLWNLNTTNTDTLATLVDSAGTTGHDQSTHTNLQKASLESNVAQSKSLLHLFESNKALWHQAFPNRASETLPPLSENDFAQFLSQRLDHVASDLELFTHMQYASQLATDSMEPELKTTQV